ncbi:glycosyltransferase family 4 protein [Planococcus sp. X10-3]|uniref:glycosyltransferase family 4 protein n=1 Tax=Planococcus sp. X10-3 TaxID=3061240 RepID=UPI003BAF30F1
MKILNINSYYYSSSVHFQLQNSLKYTSVDSTTYVPVSKNYIPRDDQKIIQEKNLKVSKCYNSNDRYIFYVKHKKILDDIIPRFNFEEFDYVHAHSLFSNGFIALGLKKKYGLPYIVAVRDADVNTFFKYVLYLRQKGIEILKEADKIIFLSEPYKNYVINKYIPKEFREFIFSKSKVIPNGIDDFWHLNKNSPKVISKQKNVKLLYVGAINKRKNLLRAIKAIDILESKGYNIEFNVVGKIEDKSIYHQLTQRNYFHYIAPLPKEKLIEVFRANDIFIMPSKTETFGLVYAEAMSQGLPVIYTKGQGFDEHFDNGLVGYHVNCYDIYDISGKISKILNEYNLMSLNSVELVKKFKWKKIAEEYVGIYNKNSV